MTWVKKKMSRKNGSCAVSINRHELKTVGIKPDGWIEVMADADTKRIIIRAAVE